MNVRVTAQPHRARKLTRTEKAEENRKALFRAAAEVIGKHGYNGATIARITERAGLAQGTFYLYFETRQDLLDQLLPTVGKEMIAYITHAVSGSGDLFEIEERGFRAFFNYLTENRSFFRILNEADTHAPKAFEKHFELLASHYISAMSRAITQHDIDGYTIPELEIIVYILMAARHYIYLKCVRGQKNPEPVPEMVVQTYMRFIRYGLHGSASASA